ncbi:MAG: AAA family ATPase, partial [archaeon]|nr:AAA family ATPase [archaeon]
MENDIFKRKAYDRMLDWKTKSNGETALLIEGARRVGKTTIVRRFAENEYGSRIIIDFANVSESTRKVFEEGLGEGIDNFLMKLQVSEGVSLIPRNGVIVFDDVQKCLKAREMVKYLVADGRFDYIETGSLITTMTRYEDRMNPSEERRMKMYPMDFEEFLWTMGDEVTIPYMKSQFDNREPLGNTFHTMILRKFREYMIVGGMPQAVDAYGPHKDIESAEAAKRDILNQYLNDMVELKRVAGKNVKGVFESIPSMLEMKNKRFSPGRVKKGARTRDLLHSIGYLNDAMLVNTCIECYDPSPALKLSLDDEVMKCYILDTGLLVTMALGSENAVGSEVYRELILGKLSVNKGMFFENVVAQHLVSLGHELKFNRFEHEGKNHEINFLLSKKNKVVPV